MAPSPINHKLSLTAILTAISIPILVSAVNLDKYDNLTREEFLELDRDVSNYFLNHYERLDEQNSTYDELLYQSIYAVRHAVVMNLLDYMYTDDEVMRNSQGSAVDRAKCLQGLEILNEMARDLAKQHQSAGGGRDLVPPSAISFVEANGKVEAGALNGNFIWWGSPSSCAHGSIGESSVKKYLHAKTMDTSSAYHIRGRFCVAHLKAKSWPKDDKYFGSRLSLKVGVCLPEGCHSTQYFSDEKMRHQVNQYARINLDPPYSGDRYHIDYLYCFPDEDSEFRRWDLGTKLFVAFISIWALILIYTNYKYHKRVKLMKELNDNDIRTLINQNKQQNKQQASGDRPNDRRADSSDDEEEAKSGRPVFRQKIHPPAESGESARTGTSLQSPADNKLFVPSDVSPGQTPQPSDLEDNDGEFNVIRPIAVDKKLMRPVKAHESKRTESPAQSKAQQQQQQQHAAPKQSSGVDFVKAFSVEANLSFLFGSKTSSSTKTDTSHANRAPSISQQDMRKLSQQLSAINRRTSASNEILLSKQYDEQEAEMADDSEPAKRRKRVNIDVLDGIKVFATAYIVCGHVMMFFYGSIVDLRFSDERMFDKEMIAVINSLQVVGLFYIITGALFTYLAFSRMKSKQLLSPSFWALVIAGRYIRLLPSYLLVFWFARHVAPFTGSGPYWHDYRTDGGHHRGYCATESWWTAITMSAADVKLPYDCVPQTWYLSNDFRTLLALPFYVALLVYNQTAGYVAIFSTILFSSWKMRQILELANIDYKIILYWQPHVYSLMTDRLHDVYTDFTIRMSTYMLGVMVGHLLYLYETRQIRQWPRWLQDYGLKGALITGFNCFWGAIILSSPIVNQFLPHRDDIDSQTAVNLVPVFKTLMEVCIAVTLLMLMTGGGYKWIRDLLMSKMFQVLSRISYGIFLVHVEVMYKMPATKFESDWAYLYLYCTFFTAASVVVAFILYVFYEMPINNLQRYVLKRALNAVKG